MPSNLDQTRTQAVSDVGALMDLVTVLRDRDSATPAVVPGEVVTLSKLPIAAALVAVAASVVVVGVAVRRRAELPHFSGLASTLMDPDHLSDNE